jgi:hypothetical protein
VYASGQRTSSQSRGFGCDSGRNIAAAAARNSKAGITTAQIIEIRLILPSKCALTGSNSRRGIEPIRAKVFDGQDLIEFKREDYPLAL